MTATTSFTTADAHAAGERIRIDWATSPFDAEQSSQYASAYEFTVSFRGHATESHSEASPTTRSLTPGARIVTRG